MKNKVLLFGILFSVYCSLSHAQDQTITGKLNILPSGWGNTHIPYYTGDIYLSSFTGSSGGALIFRTYDGSGYTNRFRVAANGNVGIGLDNPSSKLHVNGTTNLQMKSNGGTILRLDTERPWEFRQIGTGATANLELYSTVDAKHFFINTTGGVGIGTTSISSYKLSVNGTIRAKEVKVETGWSDFVFEENYPLKPLTEVEAFIKENGHLPDIPSAKEVEENGVNVGEMEAKLLQKIEELTLYVIELNKENELQDERNNKLLEIVEEMKKKNEALVKEIETIKNK